MMAALFNGPLDGLVYPLKDGQKVVSLCQPRMTTAQMIALDLVAREQTVIPLVEYVYIEDIHHELTQQGFPKFLYSGERVIK